MIFPMNVIWFTLKIWFLVIQSEAARFFGPNFASEDSISWNRETVDCVSECGGNSECIGFISDGGCQHFMRNQTGSISIMSFKNIWMKEGCLGQSPCTPADYCPSNTSRRCLPSVYLHFDFETVFENHGATFVQATRNGQGKALRISGEPQYALIGNFPADSPILRPHLAPDGFTLAFWTKIRTTGNQFATVISSRSHTKNVGHGYGFVVMVKATDTKIEFNVVRPVGFRKLGIDTSIPTDWMHIVMTYKYETDSLKAYFNGVKRPEVDTAVVNDVIPNTNSLLAVGIAEVTDPNSYGNCDVDDVMIFEVELGPEDVQFLYESY